MEGESTGEGQGLVAALSNLSQREKLLLGAMASVAALIAMLVVVNVARQAVADVEEETRQYQTALSALIDHGPEYAAAQAATEPQEGAMSRVDMFTDDVLNDNQVQLTSYVASHASAVGVSVSSYDVDETPIGSAGGPGTDGPMIEERRLRIDIRNAQMDSLVDLLHRIEESREPVVITRVDIRSVREEGYVRALVVVSTYQYADNGQES